MVVFVGGFVLGWCGLGRNWKDVDDYMMGDKLRSVGECIRFP